MKKLIVMTMLILPSLASAQSFVLDDFIIEETDDQIMPIKNHDELVYETIFNIGDKGFTNRQDPNRNFTVYEVNGKSSKDLYDATYSFIARKFKSPKDNISTNPYSFLSINTIVPDAIHKGGYNGDLELTFSVEFKDGKIRFNYPNIGQIWVKTELGALMLKSDAFIGLCADKKTYMSGLYFFIDSLIKGIIESCESINESDW